MILRLVPLAALTIALFGCGRKAAVRAPEDVAPRAVVELTALNESDGVHLSWPRPRVYVDGSPLRDLGSFEVWRVTPESDSSFTHVTTIAVNDRERFQQAKRFSFVDKNTDSGKVYQYYVVAFTVDAYASAPSNIATITREIPKRE